MGKVLILSAPSGSGKSTIIGHLLKKYPVLEFSVSATTRKPRGEERDGIDYYFLTEDEFKRRVNDGQFIEWEEVYHGSCYGTLKSEIDRIWSRGNIVVFDIDVQGAMNIKKFFGGDAVSVFITPPSIEELRKRLVSRGTDNDEAIEKRIHKAEYEMSFAKRFDTEIVNDDLEKALKEADEIVEELIKR